ncbi:similar to Saccharomyces cerevisiae YER093C-A AIM11 Protein of unknown function [Maudiozyma saulgeensis]|uniref:Altered inheritance of mitochondria protein 11 n=1 Tax=Maudiozyma saulgeensis TaxID=1789683 RepID=A0A1X7R4X8_9SACH|nr:similar to Saccharomyces cerevisiae YER093C-A AIM11 Protein of unknown function [Kazachstania saulgeensis]
MITDSDKFKARRKQQMLRFFGATLLTLLSFKIMLKQLQTVKYVPNLFQQNIKQVPSAKKQKIGKSLGGTVGITLGGFLMGITGTCWTLDIGTLDEFKQKFHGIDSQPDVE